MDSAALGREVLKQPMHREPGAQQVVAKREGKV